jgi:hypothetical protein
MASAQLSLIPEIAPVLTFDGATFDPELDGPRLTSQLAAARALMLDGKWRTIEAVVDALRKSGIHATERSVSARLRDLRKPAHGGWILDKRRIGDPKSGYFEYRLVPSERLLDAPAWPGEA